MLAKCTNASCSASFRRLDEGQLFQLENAQTVGASTNSTEYFWLCRDCSAGMALSLSQDGKVLPTGLREAIYEAHKSHSSRSIVRMGYVSVVLASFGAAILRGT